MSEQESWCYVARCSDCGDLVMAYCDTPEAKSDIARETAACIRKGYTVERVTLAAVRGSEWCKCPPKRRQR